MITKPQRLYYFMPDKCMTSSAETRGNLQERHLKISFANAVNDIFEMRPFDFGSGRSGQELRSAWDSAITKHAMEQGFISFSSAWSSPTMWAHYANNHAGCCLGFDVSGERSGQPFVEKIRYAEFLSNIDMRVAAEGEYREERIRYASTTKHKHWEYEKEFRVWVSLDKDEIEQKKSDPTQFFFVRFNEKLRLREVIVGAKSKHKPEELNEYLLPDDDVIIRTARPSFRKFEMVEQSDE